MNEALPVKFEPDGTALVPVKPDPKALKKAEDKAIYKMHQQFNGRVMRVKTKLLAEAGVNIEKWGVRKVGHGRVFFGGENADEVFTKIGEDIERLMAQTPPADAAVIAELRHHQLRANQQILDSGKMHLEAVREASSSANKGLQIAFPVGGPVQVAIAQSAQGTQEAQGDNDKEKALTQGDSGT